MSILIKDMDMPSKCGECPLHKRTKNGLMCVPMSKKCGYSNNVSLGSIGLPHHCPLVEVKSPHGRIIDESKITKYEQIGLIIKDGNVNRCILTDAPTVIEAEE